MVGIKQAVIAGLGASAVAGGGYGAYYLLSDKTIEDKLNKEDFKFIKEAEGYQVAFKELKGETAFIDDIKAYDAQIKNTSNFTDGGVALSKWCNAKIKESLNVKDVGNLVEKVKKYCKERPLTIGGKLGKKLLTTGWEAKLDALKPTASSGESELLKDLRDTDSNVTSLELPSKDKVVNALSKWCQDNYSKKLIKDTEDKIYPKVDKRCT